MPSFFIVVVPSCFPLPFQFVFSFSLSLVSAVCFLSFLLQPLIAVGIVGWPNHVAVFITMCGTAVSYFVTTELVSVMRH